MLLLNFFANMNIDQKKKEKKSSRKKKRKMKKSSRIKITKKKVLE